MWGGNARADSNRLCRAERTCWDWMWNQCKGHWQKKLGFMQSVPQYTTLPKPKVRAKTLTGYFQPIIISHKSQTSPDQCLWQHDWWVCRCECQEKWSPAPYLPYFSLWVRLSGGGGGEGLDGGLMERSHGRCDEHYPVIMKGTQLYCQSLQTGGRAGGWTWPGCWEAFVHSCVYIPLISLSGEQDK